MRKKIKRKINKIIIIAFLPLFMAIGLVVTVHAESSLQIIQCNERPSVALKKSIYIGENTKWDVMLDGLPNGCLVSEDIKWNSSYPDVVSVDEKGTLQAKTKGRSAITIVYQPDGSKITAYIRVKQPATSVTMPNTAAIMVGTPKTLSASVNPDTTDDKLYGFTWESSNPSIATVSAGGKVTGKKNGTVIITANFTNRNRSTEIGSPVLDTVSASTKVTVTTPVTKVTLNTPNLNLGKGKKYNLKAIVYPTTASNKKVTWKSSDPKVASVSSTGQVTAKKIGYSVITVTTEDGKKVFQGKVWVKKTIGYSSLKGSDITNNYVYSFDNSRNNFVNKSVKNYYLNASDKTKLINHLIRYGKSKEDAKAIVNKGIKSKWNGSCYGIITSIIINRTHQTNLRTYTKSAGKGYELNKVKAPKNNYQVMSAINYYQISQGYFDEEVYIYTKGKANWTPGLKKIVSLAKANRLQSFSMRWKGKSYGHQILIKNYVKTSGGYYWLSTYDPNHPKQKTYVKIATNYKTIKVTNYADPTEVGTLYNFSCYKAMDLDF